MANVTKKNYEVPFLPEQYKFLHSNAKEVLYSGAYRAGKSKALCYALVKHAQIPNNNVLLTRKVMQSIRGSTLQTLLGGANPVLPKGTYKYNHLLERITLVDGGNIWIRGLNDMQNIRSMEFSVVGVDEAIQLDLEEYLELFGRCSLDIPGAKRQIYLVTNPATPAHWIYQRFFKENSPDREVFTCQTIDNWFLPPDYMDILNTYPPNLYKKYALGEWTCIEGAVYPNFNRNLHVRKIRSEEYNEFIIGVDVGFTDQSAILLIGKNGSRLNVIEEYYKNEVVEAQLIKVIKNMVEKCNNPYIIVVDPSQASFIQTLKYNGLEVTKANNDIIGGISRVRQKLEVRNDRPDLIINDTCTNLVEELEAYQYREGTEKPIDKFNHLCDSLRYAINYVEDETVEYSTPIVG